MKGFILRGSTRQVRSAGVTWLLFASLTAMPAKAQFDEEDERAPKAEKAIQRAERLSAHQGTIGGALGAETAGPPSSPSSAAAFRGTFELGMEAFTLEEDLDEPATDVAAPGLGADQWAESKRKVYLNFPRVKFGVTVQGGYDSNPDAVHDAKGAAFAQLGVRATWDIDRGPVYVGPYDPDLHYDRVLNFTYEGGARFYEGPLDESNPIQQTFNLSYKTRVAERLLLYVQASDVWTHIDESPFLNTIAVLPAARYYWTDWLATEFGYSYSNFEYLFDLGGLPVPDPSVLDPDADLHQVGPTLLLFAPRPELVPDAKRRGPLVFPHVEKIALGYAHAWNDADGADLEYEGDRVTFAISGLRFWSTQGAWMDFAYSHEWNDYANPSVLSPTGEVRDDEVSRLAAAFNFVIEPLYDEASGRVGIVKMNLELVDNESNIQVRDFDQFILSLGFSYQF